MAHSVPTHLKVGNLCSIPIAERQYVSRQSTPTLSPFEVDRAYGSLLQNVYARFSGSSWRQRMHLLGSPAYLLRNLGLEILILVLIRLCSAEAQSLQKRQSKILLGGIQPLSNPHPACDSVFGPAPTQPWGPLFRA